MMSLSNSRKYVKLWICICFIERLLAYILDNEPGICFSQIFWLKIHFIPLLIKIILDTWSTSVPSETLTNKDTILLPTSKIKR